MKKLLMIAFVSAGYAALGAEYTLKSTVSGVFDWTDASNYIGESAPTEDPSTVIKVPAGVSVTLTDELSAGSLALLDAIDRIAPQADDSVVTIDVGSGRTFSLNCAINTMGSSSDAKGKILKIGGGTVELNSYMRYPNFAADYYVTDLEVQAGTVMYPQNLNVTGQTMLIGKLTVAEGATVFLPWHATTQIYNGIWGGGLITNTIDYTSYSVIDGITLSGPYTETPAVFSGRIGGYFSITIHGNQQFTGVANSLSTISLGNHQTYAKYTSERSACSTVGFTTLGKQGSYPAAQQQVADEYLSSIGYHQVNLYPWGGHLVYLGPGGEASSKNIVVQRPGDAEVRCEFDGGMTGGLTLTGTLSLHPTNPNTRRFYLTGSNPVPCVLQNTIQKAAANEYANFTFIKQGSGIWRFADLASGMGSKRTTGGLVAVQEGTLQIESLAAKGTVCSIGTSLYPYPSDYYELMTDPEKVAPYAIELGGANARGTLEYVGNNSVICTDRLIAMTGEGEIKSSGGALTIGGICTKGDGASTLVLGGDGTEAVNTVSGIGEKWDGALPNDGTIEVVKEGSRKWILQGENHFSKLRVKSGELQVGARYTWYKWLVKSAYYEVVKPEDAAIQFRLCELGLYAADGTRQNLGLVYNRGSYGKPAPGQIDYGFSSADKAVFDARNSNYVPLDALTDMKISALGEYVSCWYNTQTDKDASGTSRNCPHNKPLEETTWIPVVMHLSDAAKPVTRWDYATLHNGNAMEAYRTALYASVDGVNWDEVSAEATRVPKAASWMIADRAFAADDDNVHTNALGEVDGAEIPSAPSIYRNYLPDLVSLEVDHGATLTMNAEREFDVFTIDAENGTGTVNGGVWAQNGYLTLKNYRGQTDIELPAGTCIGRENLANWVCQRENGMPIRGELSIVNGRLHIERPGSMIIYR